MDIQVKIRNEIIDEIKNNDGEMDRNELMKRLFYSTEELLDVLLDMELNGLVEVDESNNTVKVT